MFKWLFIVSIAFIVALIAMGSNGADLTVEIEGVRSSEGEIRLAIFDKDYEFPQGEKLLGKEISAKRGLVSAKFKGVKPGVYAVAIHHDENGDDKMNTNFIGLPKEGYGFSNNAKVFLSPPSFKEAAFTIFNKRKIIRMGVVY